MEEIKNKIREIGIPEEHIDEIYEILTEEVLNEMFKDYTDKFTDEELETLETRISDAKSLEHFQNIIQEIAITLYGEQTEQKINEKYLSMINFIKQTIDNAKDIIIKAQQGDKEALELLQKAQQTEEYKELIEE